MVAYDPEGATEEFLKLPGSRSAEGEERWQQAGRKFKKMCGVRKRTL